MAAMHGLARQQVTPYPYRAQASRKSFRLLPRVGVSSNEYDHDSSTLTSRPAPRRVVLVQSVRESTSANVARTSPQIRTPIHMLPKNASTKRAKRWRAST